MASLYIHIPFCKKKCAYCDFASYSGRERDTARYVLAVLEEIRSAGRKYGRIPMHTAFFGGGTPSLLTGEQIADIVAAAKDAFDFADDAEWTLEANPGTVSLAQLECAACAGINRISFGMQAKQDRLLRLIGRIHRFYDVVDAVRMARQAGIDNINLDLMYALPGQTIEEFEESVRAAMALKVQHLSVYSLILEEGTPLTAWVQRGEVPPVDEESTVDFQHAAERWLSECGFERYEISNYARPGFACRHNIVYWTRGEYLGIGCAAHSLMGEARFFNPAGLDEYLANPGAPVKREVLTVEERREEAVMLMTRMTAGIDLSAYQREYGEDLLAARRESVDRLKGFDLIKIEGGRLRLTERGLDLHNGVVVELLS